MTDPLVRIWKQTRIPVIFRSGPVAPLLVKLPFAESNREWLRNGRRSQPEWLKQYHCWSIPKSWFEDVVRRSLARYFSGVYVVQPFREREKCAPACWNAKGVVCECSCMGRNHGSYNPEGWYVIDETCAVRWGDQEYSYKLLTNPPATEGRVA